VLEAQSSCPSGRRAPHVPYGDERTVSRAPSGSRAHNQLPIPGMPSVTFMPSAGFFEFGGIFLSPSLLHRSDAANRVTR
jgi:hypothetical protein